MSQSSYHSWLTSGPRAAAAPPMLHYRLYFLSGSNGRIERCEEFQAVEHSEAERLAIEKLGQQPMELWHRDKLVRCFDVPHTG